MIGTALMSLYTLSNNLKLTESLMAPNKTGRTVKIKFNEPFD